MADTRTRAVADNDWNVAVDWLLNSRHTADPDVQDTFQALADGLISRAEAETLGMDEIRARRAAEEETGG